MVKLLGNIKVSPFIQLDREKGLGGGFSEPLYVIDVNSEHNLITIGNQEALLCSEFIVDQINFVSISEITKPIKADIKIRYNDDGHSGMVYPEENQKLRIVFNNPQKSVTPGQSAVLFSGDLVIGGGIIDKRI